MICCTLIATSVAAGLVTPSKPQHKRWSVASTWPRAIVVGASLLGALGLAVAPHVSHVQARAAVSGRSVLAEIATQPICSGQPTVPARQSFTGE